MNLDSFWIVNQESWLEKIHFWSWTINPANFQKILPVFTNPTNPHESSLIFSTIAQSKSLKIWICKSWIHINRDFWTCKSQFASPNLKDFICGFVSEFFFFKNALFISICLDSCRSRCYVWQFFLRQLFWFSLTIEEWVVFRSCFRTCHWSKFNQNKLKEIADNIWIWTATILRSKNNWWTTNFTNNERAPKITK